MQTDLAMKKIFTIMTVAVLALSACNTSKEPFATAGENDSPRILNTDLPEGKGGAIPQYTVIERTTNFEYSLVYTPVKYSNVTWFIDSEKVQDGADIDMPLTAGIHVVNVEVVNGDLSTHRIFTVAVRPVANDPVLENDAEARLSAPGATVTIPGSNLDGIAKVCINGVALDATVTAEGLKVTLPATFPNGEHAVLLEDAAGFRYGAVFAVATDEGNVYENFTITVSESPYVRGDSFSAKPSASVTLSGINLDKVQSVKVAGNTVTISSQDANTLVFTCPALEPGSYDLTAVYDTDKPVSFAGSEKATLKVTKEEVIWEGSFNVTWGTAFDAVKTTLRGMVQVGTIVRGYVTGNGGQGCLATAWWRNIYTGGSDGERGDVSINGDMVLEYTLTQASLDLFDAQDGALFVGDGYTITKVTIE